MVNISAGGYSYINKKKSFTISTKASLYLMTIPFVIFILMFNYVPLLGWAIAFVKYVPGLSIFQCDFTGLHYFRMVFEYGSELPRVITNTLAMSFLGIIVSPLPILFALLLTEVTNTRIKKIFQTATSLPNFISYVIVYSLFLSIFSTDGLANQLLLNLNIVKEPTNVMGNSEITWIFQTMVLMWKTTGWSAIVYMASISGIDQELYDAARVDGAGRFRQILHITIPGVIPTYVVLLVLYIGNALNGHSFEQIYVFYNPMVHDKIETLDYYTYRIGMKMYDFSYSTAVGMFKSVISLTLLYSVNFIAKKLTGKAVI